MSYALIAIAANLQAIKFLDYHITIIMKSIW